VETKRAPATAVESTRGNIDFGMIVAVVS
jgi:hypothetical protein